MKTVMEEMCASLTALSFNSECMASISDVGLKRRPATEVVRFRIAFSGLQMKREGSVPASFLNVSRSPVRFSKQI